MRKFVMSTGQMDASSSFKVKISIIQVLASNVQSVTQFLSFFTFQNSKNKLLKELHNARTTSCTNRLAVQKKEKESDNSYFESGRILEVQRNLISFLLI